MPYFSDFFRLPVVIVYASAVHWNGEIHNRISAHCCDGHPMASDHASNRHDILVAS